MTKYEVYYSSRFKKDLKKLKHDTNLVSDLNSVIKRLANDEKLEPKYRDHALSGNMKGFRDCHVRPDVVLIYKKETDVLIMTCARIGSHSDVLSL